jgi:hypothetical protein
MKRTSAISTFGLGALLFVLMVFCLYPQASYAHAPQDVKLSYDFSAQTLTVTITHNSPFPGFHYINSVEVKKNSTVINTTNYKKQPSESPFIYTYKVGAIQGDKLEVTATCNLSGSKTEAITVTGVSK